VLLFLELRVARANQNRNQNWGLAKPMTSKVTSRRTTPRKSNADTSDNEGVQGKSKSKPKLGVGKTDDKVTSRQMTPRKSNSDTSDNEDVQSKAQKKTAIKNARKKRRAIEVKRVKAMETCEIETSDAEDSEFNFDNYAPTEGPDQKLMPPIADWWEPQNPANAKLRAPPSKSPTLTHDLTQFEMYAKYPLSNQPLPLGRLIILKQALLYKTNTNSHHRECASPRYDTAFNDQEYIDFACATDRCRPISVDPKSYDPETQQVAVFVSSYKLLPNVTLKSVVDRVPARRGLARKVHRVVVDMKWLQQSCRPDVTKVLNAMIFEDKVMRVHTHTHTHTLSGLLSKIPYSSSTK
jgi:hypothetical protein